jgi:putative ABC transport system permease protein
MNGRALFARLVVKAAWVHRERALTALLSIVVVAAMGTVALAVYSGFEASLNREFTGFGGNIVITAPNGYISADQLKHVKEQLASQGEILPLAYAIARSSSGTRIVVGGTDLQALRRMNSWWSLRTYAPARAGDSQEAMIGSRVAEILSPDGQAFPITLDHRTVEIRPAAVFHSGSDDDSRIYMGLAQFEAFTRAQPNSAYVRLDGGPREVQRQMGKLSLLLPQAQVKPVRQVMSTQSVVLGKTRSVVLYSSTVVMVLIVLCIMATLSSSVLDRRRDFAVMKALGASNAGLNLLFAGEVAFISFGGGIAGFVAGTGFSYWIGQVNFSVPMVPQPVLLAPVLLGSVGLALIASIVPLRLLQQIQPACILRGE